MLFLPLLISGAVAVVLVERTVRRAALAAAAGFQ
jgi:hypothetical protein